ncbi:primosomal protein N' [Acetobacter orientalis]|uniref:Primosomal protein N n=1 Tax=Acetobacter orientalis TaxID=146474 RepID=A0A2Z5ZFW6_9PROT|nr:primosomal protein N' [Acetobacter orientalis]
MEPALFSSLLPDAPAPLRHPHGGEFPCCCPCPLLARLTTQPPQTCH